MTIVEWPWYSARMVQEKSTISNALRARSESESLPDGICTCYLRNEGQTCPDEDKIFEHTHVFNENFINEKITVEENGLGAIVMLGETGELTSTIKQLMTGIELLESKLSDESEIISKRTDQASKLSAEYYEKQISEKLKNGGWADRAKEI